MNELYAEAVVKARFSMQNFLLKAFLIFLAVLSTFFVLFLGQSIFFPVAGIAMIAMVYLFPRLSHIEYEYIFCDGQLDFDRIASKSRRKNVLRIDMENIEVVAPFGSHYLDPGKDTIKKDFSSGNKEQTYVILIVTDGKKSRILFEPTNKMLDCMYHKSPSKVKKDR